MKQAVIAAHNDSKKKGAVSRYGILLSFNLDQQQQISEAAKTGIGKRFSRKCKNRAECMGMKIDTDRPERLWRRFITIIFRYPEIPDISA